MKTRLLISILAILLITMGCATMADTLKKPPLTIEFNYPYRNVWLVMFDIMSSQGLIFEKGSIVNKIAWYRLWDTDYGIPVMAVYLEFEEISSEKTKVVLRYNQDGVIALYRLDNKVKHLVETINNNLMVKLNEEKPRPYAIYGLKEWAERYELKRVNEAGQRHRPVR